MNTPRIRHLCLLTALLFSTTAVAQDSLTVQSHWKIGVVTLSWSSSYEAREVVVEAGEFVARELPGIHWAILPQTLRLTAPQHVSRRSIQKTLESSIKPQAGLSDVDLVVVFAPLSSTARYYGYALNRFRPQKLESENPIWYTVINTRPERVMVASVQHKLAQRGLKKLPNSWFQRLDPLSRWVDRQTPWVRHGLVSTIVHEFGHFLAPGDFNVRDGIQGRWIANGSAEKNPDRHEAHCIMYLPGSTHSIWSKARDAWPDGIRYCRQCRQRLGVGSR